MLRNGPCAQAAHTASIYLRPSFVNHVCKSVVRRSFSLSATSVTPPQTGHARPLFLHHPFAASTRGFCEEVEPFAAQPSLDPDPEEEIAENTFPLPKPEFVASFETLQTSQPLASLTSAIDADEEYFNSKSDDFLWDKHEAQLELERLAVDLAATKYREDLESITGRGDAGAVSSARKLLVRWFAKVKDAVAAKQQTIQSNPSGNSEFGPFFLSLDPAKAAIVLLHTVFGSMLPVLSPVVFTTMAQNVGTELQMQVNLEHLATVESKGRLRVGLANQTRVKKSFVPIMSKKVFGPTANWSKKVLITIGSEMLQILLDVAYIENSENVMVPAFYHSYDVSRNKHTGVMRMHELVYKTVSEQNLMGEVLHPRHLPMLVRPVPWSSPFSGGYLALDSMILRASSRQQTAALSNKRESLDDVLNCLNVLGKTRWNINKTIFKTVMEAWERGGGIADMPARNDESEPIMEAGESPGQYSRRLAKVLRNNRNLHSQRCDLELKLEVAKRFLDQDFFFPHNLDFRGRAYPIPPHLNHLGSDICRGLLLFGKGKPLGPDGLWWLKIHLANLCGKDKMSFEGRIHWIEANLENISASVRDPLDGCRWWLEADSPWQCLAVCKEICDAIDSGDPESFVSHMPVHQDGSCNGLQHYAALGLDAVGGHEVNLTPADMPQDPYTTVALMVSKMVEADAAAGNDAAQLVLGKVTRKVVKQTVMTSVYGVTYVGAREQIAGRLAEFYPEFTEREVWTGSNYLANLTMKTMLDLFTGARDIMAWLAQSARVVASQNDPMNWITPLGLPVVQPYRQLRTVTVNTLVQKVSLVDDVDYLPLSIRKQSTAFPPNFVHSLDSTHMLMTASECDANGLVFAGVHDSFWTHACDISSMNKIIRQQFVRLHSMPLLEHFHSSLCERYPFANIPALPSKGDLDLNKVLESNYFFD